MKSDRPPLFSDWPFYAATAQVAFWVVSGLWIAAWLAVFFRAVGIEIALYATLVWLGSGCALGVAALFSGRLYVGNQAFRRAPTTGWPARLYGGFIAFG
ncbi:MAG: hypothetical protein K2Q06_12455, partial [Parvularculaceae bacterium]|nr:hypothetical protein [Parvularculaceae bacterium]